MGKRGVALCSLLVVLGLIAGGWLRLVELDARVMHGDEANQAHKAGVLLETGEYQYDPQEHHGPTLYYASLPIWAIAGVDTFAELTEPLLRIVPTLFGLAALLLVLALWPALGGHAAAWAVVFAALSPALVYYSRYYIQEPLLVFFTFAAIVCGWRFLATRGWVWAGLFGVCVGLMHATKETCIIFFAAMAAGLAAAWLLARWRNPDDALDFSWFTWKHAVAILVPAAVVSVTFFSSFFSHWRGPLDSILTYTHYVEQAEDAGIHEHPWHFYLGMLLHYQEMRAPMWTEAIILFLGGLGCLAALLERRPAGNMHVVRFLAVFTLLSTVAFSAIPYKTPWNMMVFLLGLCVMSGYGVDRLWRWLRIWPRVAWVIPVLALAGVAHLGVQAHRASFEYAADFENPYAYGHTVPAITRLVDRMHDIAAAVPDGKAMRVDVIAPNADYWPLPWYLRAFERVGYWEDFPEQLDSDILIIPPAYQEPLEEELPRSYRSHFFALRPDVPVIMMVEEEVWETFMETRR